MSQAAPTAPKKRSLMTPQGRANYVYVFKPRESDEPGKEGSFSITLAMPKATSDVKALKADILRAATERWGAEAGEMLRKGKIAHPLHDGDDEVYDDPNYKGCWIMTARRKESLGPPGVVDQAVKPIIDQTEFYSGAYCQMTVSFFAYENKGKKGVGCGLNNVQKVKDGERLAGKVPAEAEFTPLEGASSASSGGDDDADF